VAVIPRRNCASIGASAVATSATQSHSVEGASSTRPRRPRTSRRFVRRGRLDHALVADRAGLLETGGLADAETRQHIVQLLAVDRADDRLAPAAGASLVGPVDVVRDDLVRQIRGQGLTSCGRWWVWPRTGVSSPPSPSRSARSRRPARWLGWPRERAPLENCRAPRSRIDPRRGSSTGRRGDCANTKRRPDNGSSLNRSRTTIERPSTERRKSFAPAPRWIRTTGGTSA
jgi:hypothetical protein